MSIVSMSRIGSTVPSTCMMSPSFEAADDVQDRVHLADVREELVAQPFARAAPRTMPAMSTTRTAAGTIFSVSMNWLMTVSRSSGTATTPTFGSIVANG